MTFEFAVGDCLCAWADGGFDREQGGIAAFLLSIWRLGAWTILERGGVYEPPRVGNNSLQMRSVAMELMFSSFSKFAKLLQ